MMRYATQKSPCGGAKVRVCWLVLGWLLLASGWVTLAEDPPLPEAVAYEIYQSAKGVFTRATDNPDAGWQFGRACFDWAEFSTNDTQRMELAKEGIQACEAAIEKDPELASAHYYLGMNQGQLARTMSLGALKLVHRMESHFLKAKELDPQFDEAGPDRNLGLLYLQAPGWPLSVGNRAKARSHLGRAVKVAPDFPENRLNLMEAYASWNETGLLKSEIEAWNTAAQAARKKFSEDRWHWDWLNWEHRLEELRQHLSVTTPDLQSPKGSQGQLTHRLGEHATTSP